MKCKTNLNLLTNTTDLNDRLVFFVRRSYWKGDTKGHARAGRLGGLKQGWKTNKANFKNDPEKARRAGKKSKRK